MRMTAQKESGYFFGQKNGRRNIFFTEDFKIFLFGQILRNTFSGDISKDILFCASFFAVLE